jgi:hypothetical protein
MRQAPFQTRIALIAAGLLAGGFSLAGCATEDYVDEHIAAVNARIDQTDSRVAAVENHVGQVEQLAGDARQRADAAASAAEAAGSAAQAAAAEAQRANQSIAEMGPIVQHLEQHHIHRTWRDVANRRAKRSRKAPGRRPGERG